MPLSSTRIAITNFGFNNPAGLVNFSDDGRWLAWVQIDGKGHFFLSLKDNSNGQIRQINAPDGAAYLSRPVFVADGSKLVFEARFSPPLQIQLYSYDVAGGKVQLVSSDANGKPLPGPGLDSEYPDYSVSDDGRFLAFATKALNTSDGEEVDLDDQVYVKDLATGSLTLVSADKNGIKGDGESHHPVISGDGHSVLFYSISRNLVSSQFGDNLFVKNLLNGEIRQVNLGNTGGARFVDPDERSLLSGDGKTVVFLSFGQVFVKNLVSGALTEVSTTIAGKPFTGQPVTISYDGRYLTLDSAFADVYTGDADAGLDIYQADLKTGQISLLTPHGARTADETDSTRVASASKDGQTILYVSTNQSIFGDSDVPDHSVSSGTINVLHLNDLPNNQGDDSFFGTPNPDQFVGGKGNDNYWVNNTGDYVGEASDGGHDLVFSTVQRYELADNVEDLVLVLSSDANTARVENASGSGNDLNNRITGNSENNLLRGLGGDDVFYGAGGNDTIDGGSGFDRVEYHADFASMSISTLNGLIKVSDSDGHSDQLQNVERLIFANAGFALPGDTHAAQAWRIYQAAFNRTPDKGGLGFWIKQIDKGTTLSDIAGGFIKSAEFKALYGAAPGNLELATKFYQNVLHRTPDAGGLDFWVDVLNSHRATPEQVLVQFAESPENQIALAGVIDHGFAFTLIK